MDIRVGEQILRLPDGASEEAIQTAIADYRKSPEFDAVIDKKSGAPARVRMLVGSASGKDKIANLRRFYSDAVEYGDDNFVFTDPASGRPTLFNPKGLDFGDVAGVAKEGAQAVGAAMGATFGAAGGLAVGAPTGPGALATASTGAAVGAGFGSAAAGALFDAAANTISGRVDTRSIFEMTTDTALDFGSAAVGQRVGEMMGEGIKKAAGGAKAAAKRIVDAFDSLRITPPAGAVSGSKSVQVVEKALESSPFSADIMQKQAETVIQQTKSAADDIAARFGQAKTKQGAGAVIKEAAAKAAERFGFTQEKAYTEAFDLVGADTPVAVGAVKALRETMENELAKAPRSLEKALKPAMAMLREIEIDAAGGKGIAFDALRQVRTMIGKDLSSPVLAGSTGAQNEAMKRVYAALTEDMSAAAQAAGPEAAKKLQIADRFTRFFMQTAAKTLEKIDKMDADERAFEFAIQSARDGGSGLARLRRHFLPEEWDTVAATVLNRMGLATAGAQDATGAVFSPSTFMTNWSRLAPEAKEALFGGARYADIRPQLDKLVTVVSSLKEVEKLTNTSNTAKNLIAFSAIQTFGAALGGLLGGNVESAGGGALVTLGATAVAPRVAAKLITHPSFVKWLTEPVTSPTGFSAHIGKLVAIAAVEPEIRGEIEQFVSALRSIPNPVSTMPERSAGPLNSP